jgi:hypothetical protein
MRRLELRLRPRPKRAIAGCDIASWADDDALVPPISVEDVSDEDLVQLAAEFAVGERDSVEVFWWILDSWLAGFAPASAPSESRTSPTAGLSCAERVRRRIMK